MEFAVAGTFQDFSRARDAQERVENLLGGRRCRFMEADVDEQVGTPGGVLQTENKRRVGECSGKRDRFLRRRAYVI